jgi:O-antigen/teichoic acid export membrane protein
MITAENAMEEYTKATGLLRVIKLIVVIFTLIIIFFIVQSAKAGHSTLSWWILPVFIAAMIIPVVISIFNAFKNKRPYG